MSVSKEVWKPIKGYEGLYEVSNLGRVRKIIYKEMKGEDHLGYRRLNLTKDGVTKPYLVHRLVAEAFIPNPENYPIINHIDECPSNNHVDNLEWCDQKHNMNCGTVRQRISENSRNKQPVIAVDKKTYERTYYPSISVAGQAVAGKQIGGSSISEALSGKRKSAYGKYWFYAEEGCDIHGCIEVGI